MSIDHKKNQRDIAVGTAASYGGFLFRLSVRIPFLFLAGMLFGAEHYGEYIFATSFVEALGVLCCLGFKRSVFGFIEESEDYRNDASAARLVTACWKLALLAAFIAAGLIFTFAGQIAGLLDSPGVQRPLEYLCWALPMIVTTDLLLSGCRYKRKIRYEVYARSVAEPVTLTLLTVAFYFSGLTDTGLLLAYLIAIGSASLVAMFGMHASYERAEFFSISAIPHAVRLLRRAAPTGLYEFLKMLLDRLHIMIVTFFFSESVTGVYGAAVQFTTLLNKIGAGFEPILAPVIAQLTNRGSQQHLHEQLSRIIRWVMSIEFLLLVIFLLFGRALLGLIGEEFEAGEYIMWILVCAVSIQSAFLCNDLPVLFRKPEWNLWIILVLVGLCLAIAVLLAPVFGAEGVALAVLVTHASGALLSSGLIHHLFKVWPVERATFSPVISLVSALTVGWALKLAGAPVFLNLLVVLVIYLAAGFRFSATQQERDWLLEKYDGWRRTRPG